MFPVEAIDQTAHPDKFYTPLTLEAVQGTYQGAIEQALQTVGESRIATTPAGRLALAYAVAAQRVLHPLIADEELPTSPLYLTTGGANYNPIGSSMKSEVRYLETCMRLHD